MVSLDDGELPAIFRTETHSIVLPSDNVQAFLKADLSVKQLEDISPRLWAAGRPYLPRPLNIQGVLNRTIVPTTDASLHLLWTSRRIFIKALPAYFLATNFYEHYLQGPGLNGPALGLLYSYLALVPTELDFALAHEAHLLPPNLKWTDWRLLVRRVLKDHPDTAIYSHIPKRYIYGELRLDRLDIIYKYLHGNWLYGYSSLTSPQTYSDFIAANLIAVATVSYYILLVLTAMQLGLSSTKDALITNTSFQRACYGFAAFSLVSPIIAIGLIVAAALAMFFAHWARTLKREHIQYEQLGMEPLRKSGREAVDGKTAMP